MDVATGTTRKGRILIAIPAFNEEFPIAAMVLRSRQHADAVLVVDDGSTDRTAEHARLAGATVIQHPSNMGKGAAIATALRYAVANGLEVLVLLDGDGQHDPGEIPRLLAPLMRTNDPVDFVLGDRTGGAQQMPKYRAAGKAVLDKATAVASGSSVIDSQCGFRALGHRGIEAMLAGLASTGFEVESEMIVVAQRYGLKVESVPVTIRYEGVDGSTKHPLPHAARVMDRLFVFLALRRPLLTLGVPGIASIIFGGYWGLRMLQVYQTHRIFVQSYGLGAATFVILGGILVATALMLNVLILLRPRIGRRTT